MRFLRFVLCVIAAPIAVAQSILTYAGGGSRDGLQAKAIVLTAPYIVDFIATYGFENLKDLLASLARGKKVVRS